MAKKQSTLTAKTTQSSAGAVKRVQQEKREPATPASTRSILTFIVSAAFFLYSGTFKNRFVLDDHGIIKSNNITNAPVSWENTKLIFSTPLREGAEGSENSLYRPFTKLIFNIEWNILDGNPHAFHVVNAAVYALLCALIFSVLYHAMGKKWLVPFISTLLFLVHPLHAEVVANVKSMDEILGLTGIVFSLRCLQLYFAKQKSGWLLGSYLSFLAGLFSKESAIVGVLLIPTFLYFFSSLSLKRIGMLSTGFLLAALVLSVPVGHYCMTSSRPHRTNLITF